jgi:hypothetical protein
MLISGEFDCIFVEVCELYPALILVTLGHCADDCFVFGALIIDFKKGFVVLKN